MVKGRQHPAAPRTPEEAATDEKMLNGLMPDILEYVKTRAARRGETLVETVNWMLGYSKNRLVSLDNYEANSKCDTCKKKSCKCPPSVLKASKEKRDAEARARDIAALEKGEW